VKKGEEAMEILEAYDVTGSLRGFAALCVAWLSRADGYATWLASALSGSTRPSCLREVMSSLLNTLRRW
jgi:hypothetical protein